MTTLTDIPLGYAYVNFCLGALIAETGWDNLTYIFLVEDVWRAMDISAEPSDSSELKEYYARLKYRALAHLQTEFSTAYDYTADGESFKRSQMFDQVSKMVDQARTDALPYLIQGQIEQGRLTYPDDPYSIDGQVEHNA